MSKEILRIGLPSKGRIRSGCIDILKKKKIKVFSERGDRDLFGIVKNKPNLQILYMHSREIISNLAKDDLDITNIIIDKLNKELPSLNLK